MKFVSTILGTIGRATRQVSRVEGVSEKELSTTRGIADVISRLIRRITELEAAVQSQATEFEVNVGGLGSTVTLAHGFNCPVRYTVTHWAKIDGEAAPAGYHRHEYSLIARNHAVGVITGGASGTHGCIYQLKRSRNITGIRFAWLTNSTDHTATVKLWDSGGTLLASGSVTVNKTGIYDVFFTTPYTQMATSTDFVVSVYAVTGGGAKRWTFTTNTDWASNIELGADLLLVSSIRYNTAGNDAFPDGNVVGGSFLIEPILGHENAGPELVVDSTSDSNNLVLKSYTRGKAVIRVEPSQFGVKQ